MTDKKQTIIHRNGATVTARRVVGGPISPQIIKNRKEALRHWSDSYGEGFRESEEYNDQIEGWKAYDKVSGREYIDPDAGNA